MALETRLIIRKESKFDKIRKRLLMIFFKDEYFLMEQFNELIRPKRIKPKNIIIPKEIGKNKEQKRRDLNFQTF